MRPARSNEHGQYGYARRCNCNCDSCKDALYRYAKGLRTDHALGRARTVDAAPTQRHLRLLQDLGATIAQMSTATGDRVQRAQIRNLINGTNHITGKTVRFIYPETARALLALDPRDVLAVDTLVTATGLHRRIQALQAVGFTKADIATEMGISESAVHHYCIRDRCTTRVLAAVTQAYDRMCMKTGRSETQRWKAIREGWLPPLAWDEGAIDDPEATPNYDAVVCAVPKCNRTYAARGLCRQHDQAIPHGLKPSAFRVAVLRQTTYAGTGTKDLLADLRELKAQGATPFHAAVQLGRGKDYIKKVWSQA